MAVENQDPFENQDPIYTSAQGAFDDLYDSTGGESGILDMEPPSQVPVGEVSSFFPSFAAAVARVLSTRLER